MLKASPVSLAWSLRSKKGDMNRVLEGHFWSLTRYRILPRFIGLDYAGNIIFYRSYRKQTIGGWTAVTLGAPGSSSSSFLSSDMSAVNVLEDGYPMHYKASRRLQAYVAEEKKKWTAKEEKMVIARREKAEADKRAAAAAASGSGGGAAKGATAAAAPAPDVEITADATTGYDSEQQFRDMLAIRCSNPRFYSHKLRVNFITTFLYKCVYFYLWAVFVSLIIQGYLMFRAWLNPPARSGLKNIEDHVLHFPKVLFAGCVHSLAWLARTSGPIIDPVLAFLTEYFPQVDWNAASAEKLASRAEGLANDAHPAATERKEAQRQVEVQTEAARRTWWTRVLLALLAIFSVLCVL